MRVRTHISIWSWLKNQKNSQCEPGALAPSYITRAGSWLCESMISWTENKHRNSFIFITPGVRVYYVLEDHEHFAQNAHAKVQSISARGMRMRAQCVVILSPLEPTPPAVAMIMIILNNILINGLVSLERGKGIVIIMRCVILALAHLGTRSQGIARPHIILSPRSRRATFSSSFHYRSRPSLLMIFYNMQPTTWLVRSPTTTN